MHRLRTEAVLCALAVGLCLAGMGAGIAGAQSASPVPDLYAGLKAFELGGGVHEVENLTIRRDRAELTFNGTFYFETPIDGEIYGAVFLGEGRFRSDVPNTNFERGQVRRMLDSDLIETDFSRAVLRFSDDTFDLIGPTSEGATLERAVDLAEDFEPRFLRETGANLSARVATFIVNLEDPGFFVAEFDGGRHDRFTLLLDSQTRILSMHFGINGGEKGLIFSNEGDVEGNDIWAAFYSLEDIENGIAPYSDAFDLVDVEHYEMDVDVRDPRDTLGLEARIRLASRSDGLRAIPFTVSESLPEARSQRRDRGMHLSSARLDGGETVPAVQEEWEGGLTVFLPEPLDSGQEVTLVLELDGDFMLDSTAGSVTQNFYPMVNTEWYPRHGYLDRATYELTFHHNEDHKVASTGVKLSEEVLEDPDEGVTVWSMDHPVALVTFAVGLFDVYEENGLIDGDVPVTFYSIRAQRLSEDFIAAEMANAINYYTATFGPYPYETFTGTQHPRAFGQGFPSLLLIPAADTSNRDTYAFLAHETAHQWWGHIVSWRSYRDQWLSEGFAEYSGMLYTGLRDGANSERELIERSRRSLINPPVTNVGVGPGKLAEIGPLIMGIRLNSSRTRGAYQALIYQKGALVLRMLHYLFSDPLTGDSEAFFEMMSDFVERHRNGWATTDTFRQVANEHFARSPFASRWLNIDNLDWFFQQWVYEAYLPSYRMEYRVEEESDGSFTARGVVRQEDVPEGFVTPLPVMIEFGDDLVGRWPVFALGPETPFEIRLPQEPERLELDPDLWILSEETSTRKR